MPAHRALKHIWITKSGRQSHSIPNTQREAHKQTCERDELRAFPSFRSQQRQPTEDVFQFW